MLTKVVTKLRLGAFILCFAPRDATAKDCQELSDTLARFLKAGEVER